MSEPLILTYRNKSIAIICSLCTVSGRRASPATIVWSADVRHRQTVALPSPNIAQKTKSILVFITFLFVIVNLVVVMFGLLFVVRIVAMRSELEENRPESDNDTSAAICNDVAHTHTHTPHTLSPRHTLSVSKFTKFYLWDFSAAVSQMCCCCCSINNTVLCCIQREKWQTTVSICCMAKYSLA